MPVGKQDPVTELLLQGGSDCGIPPNDPIVDLLQVQSMAEPELQPMSKWEVKPRNYCAQPAKELERENGELKQQVKQQFQDLGQLDQVLDQLETQVDGHETIIKQQSQRIQEQEETIQQLNSRMQQYLAALIMNTYKTRF